MVVAKKPFATGANQRTQKKVEKQYYDDLNARNKKEFNKQQIEKEKIRLSKLTPAEIEAEEMQKLAAQKLETQRYIQEQNRLHKLIIKLQGVKIHTAKNTYDAIKIVRDLLISPTFDMDVSGQILNPKEEKKRLTIKNQQGAAPYSVAQSQKFGWLGLLNRLSPTQRKLMNPKWLRHIVIVHYSQIEKLRALKNGGSNPIRRDTKSSKFILNRGKGPNDKLHYIYNYKPSKGRVGVGRPKKGSALPSFLHELARSRGFRSYKYKFEIYINPNKNSETPPAVFVHYNAANTIMAGNNDVPVRELRPVAVNIRFQVALELLNLRKK